MYRINQNRDVLLWYGSQLELDQPLGFLQKFKGSAEENARNAKLLETLGIEIYD